MKKCIIVAVILAYSTTYAQTSCKCSGSGQETLVLEAGMGGWSIMYKPLIAFLEKDFRVCVIDRDGYSGYSKSEKSDSESISREIYGALKMVGINYPVILIGHSFGGLNVRLFQHLYPDLVKGMILLDATHPDQFDRLPVQFRELKERQPEQMKKVEKIAKKGHLKYSKKSIPTFGLPEEYLEEYYSVTMQPFYYRTYYNEVRHFDLSLSQVSKIKNSISIPLLVLSSENSMDKESMPGKNKKYPYAQHNLSWLELQQELTHVGVNSEWKVIDGNHYFFISNPEETGLNIKDFLNRRF